MSDGYAPRTLGELIQRLESSEEAFRANSRTADKYVAEGRAEALWWQTQAAVLRFQPDPSTMPGIDRIEILCDLEGAGSGLTSANVRRLRAKLCTEAGIAVEQADSLPLVDAADAIEKLRRTPATVANSSEPEHRAVNLLDEFRRALAEHGNGEFVISVLKPPHQLAERPTFGGRMLGSMWVAGHAVTKGEDFAFIIHHVGHAKDSAIVERFRNLAGQAGAMLTPATRDAIQLGYFDSPQAAWCANLLAMPRAQARGFLQWSGDVGFIFNAFAASAYALEESMVESKAVGPSNNEGSRGKVFVSYSHKDKKFCDDLLAHLKPLERAGWVSAWSDKQIAPGSKWFDEIRKALAETTVAVMLVTKDFLASDFIHEHELGPLLKEAEHGGLQIRWVLVRACNYKETPLKDYQAVIPLDKPLAEMKADRDSAWVKICEEIKKAAADASLPSASRNPAGSDGA